MFLLLKNCGRWQQLGGICLLLSLVFLGGPSGSKSVVGKSGYKSAEDRIHTPKQNFHVLLENNNGKLIKIEQLTWERNVFLEVQYNNIPISLPFASLRSLERVVAENDEYGDLIQIKVILSKGDVLVMNIDRHSKFYGKTILGNDRILLRDIHRIKFLKREISFPLP